MGGGEDFFIRPAVATKRVDGFTAAAAGIAGECDSVVEQGAGFGVERGLAVVALDLGGERFIIGESTEILPVGFGSIEAVEGTRGNGGDHLAHRARERSRRDHQG